jgi:hypothetical protein
MKKKFYFNKIKIDTSMTDTTMTMHFKGDIEKDYVFRSPHKINEAIALLTAHVCSIPFQIQAERFVITTPLKHRRMERFIEIFRANMATYISLYDDYPNEIRRYRLKQYSLRHVLDCVTNTSCLVAPQSAAIAVSAGKESLLGAYLLADIPTEHYTVNNANFMTNYLLKCPLDITRHPIHAPKGWRSEYNMTLPWRLFTLAAAADRAPVLFFGDEFETNQALSLHENYKVTYFLTDDFDQSVYVSGLLNWALEDVTKTRLSSLVSNLCELQIQGILDDICSDYAKQVSCWGDIKWCDDCAKCNRFSLMFEALRGTSAPLTPLTDKAIARMTPTQMWAYCCPLQKRQSYLKLAAYAPGRDSLEILRNIIYKRRNIDTPIIPTSTDFLAQRLHSTTMPILPTPFDVFIDRRLLQFKARIDKYVDGNFS